MRGEGWKGGRDEIGGKEVRAGMRTRGEWVWEEGEVGKRGK